jgi:hypothetical protein
MSNFDVLYMLSLFEVVMLRYNQTGGRLSIEDKSIILDHVLSYLKSRIGSIQRDHKQYLTQKQQMLGSFRILENSKGTIEHLM